MESSILTMDIENITRTVKELATVTFSWYDYTLFILMLGLSILISGYFAFFGKKDDSKSEYLLGGKNMGIIPISLSLVSSLISGMTLLAVPADTYSYGIAYWLLAGVIFISCIFSTYVIIPVFYKCQFTSTYEYLEKRFDKRLRVISSFLYALANILFLPIVIYIPALAFAQVTNSNVHIISPVITLICTFYTTIGGLKAVVWTDTLQLIAMIGGSATIFYMGTMSAGGFGEVWRISKEGQRLELDFDVSPFKRDTVWSVCIGLTISWIYNTSISQGSVQKFLALGSLKKTKGTMVIFSIGMALITSSCVFTGLIMYAIYHDCDPYATKQVVRYDQLLPYYVMDVAGDIPGLSGLFIAGIFCAGLSTLSSSMNSLSGTIYEDFISPFMSLKVSEKTVGYILKFNVIVIGIISTALVFLVENLGGLLPLSLSFGGATVGPIMGLFTLGMLVPWANASGAFWGAMASMIVSFWMLAGAQYYQAKGYLSYPKKPISTDGCDFSFNSSTFRDTNITESDDHEVFFLYRITYYYYALIGLLIIFIIALPISWFTRHRNPPVNKNLISPCMHWAVLHDDVSASSTLSRSSHQDINIH